MAHCRLQGALPASSFPAEVAEGDAQRFGTEPVVEVDLAAVNKLEGFRNYGYLTGVVISRESYTIWGSILKLRGPLFSETPS